MLPTGSVFYTRDNLASWTEAGFQCMTPFTKNNFVIMHAISSHSEMTHFQHIIMAFYLWKAAYSFGFMFFNFYKNKIPVICNVIHVNGDENICYVSMKYAVLLLIKPNQRTTKVINSALKNNAVNIQHNKVTKSNFIFPRQIMYTR